MAVSPDYGRAETSGWQGSTDCGVAANGDLTNGLDILMQVLVKGEASISLPRAPG